MSKDLLNKIKGAIDKNQASGSVKQEEKDQAEPSYLKDNQSDNSKRKEKPRAKAKASSDNLESAQPKPKKGLTGFEELQDILKAEKDGFSFNRRLVYIDDNIGDALDLLRKEAKINSNVLASYLLKQFLLDNKDLIKDLRDKRKGNIFFD